MQTNVAIVAESFHCRWAVKGEELLSTFRFSVAVFYKVLMLLHTNTL